MAKRWYIVHAYTNFERKVADAMRERAKQSGRQRCNNPHARCTKRLAGIARKKPARSMTIGEHAAAHAALRSGHQRGRESIADSIIEPDVGGQMHRRCRTIDVCKHRFDHLVGMANNLHAVAVQHGRTADESREAFHLRFARSERQLVRARIVVAMELRAVHLGKHQRMNASPTAAQARLAEHEVHDNPDEWERNDHQQPGHRNGWARSFPNNHDAREDRSQRDVDCDHQHSPATVGKPG